MLFWKLWSVGEKSALAFSVFNFRDNKDKQVIAVNFVTSPAASTAAMLQVLNALPNNVVATTVNSDKLPVTQLLLNSLFVCESHTAVYSSSSRATANTQTYFISYRSTNNLVCLQYASEGTGNAHITLGNRPSASEVTITNI